MDAEDLHMRQTFLVCGLITGVTLSASVAGDDLSDKSKSRITPDALKDLLDKARVQNDVPALAAGIVCRGQPPLAVVVGVRKRGTQTAVTSANQWHIGSNTKPFTAFLTALLIEEGLFDWDTSLDEIFPDEAKNWNDEVRKITPAHLLTHTSGLPANGPLAGFLIFRNDAAPLDERARLVRALDTIKSITKSGEKYLYSNLGYVVLGAIIDKRGKKPWEEQLELKILKPLGIEEWGLGPLVVKDADVQPWPHRADGKPLPPKSISDNPQVMNSAGRLRLSVTNYNRFLAEVLRLAKGEKGLLKQATSQKLLSNPYPVSPHSLSGWVGFRKETDAKGLVLVHDGSNSFNYCTAIVEPDKNRAFCVLTNQGGPGDDGAKACRRVAKELRQTESGE
jgi:CubicO group peptidase (beta-lactamase class C family)